MMNRGSITHRISKFAENCTFPDGFSKSLSVITDALRLYGCHSLALSFSGGKEACVMLFLLKYCVLQAGLGDDNPFRKSVKFLYFSDCDMFPEVESFLAEIQRELDIQLVTFSCSYKEGMTTAVSELGVKAVFMGVRIGDPYTETVQHFQPSSPSWPPFMRINPVMHWSYGEVWEFLRVCELPYCALYDQGYTSLGNRKNTVRNEKLLVRDSSGKVTYLPAYRLKTADEHLERKNRTSNSSASIDASAAVKSTLIADSVMNVIEKREDRRKNGALILQMLASSVQDSCELIAVLQNFFIAAGVTISKYDISVIGQDLGFAPSIESICLSAARGDSSSCPDVLVLCGNSAAVYREFSHSSDIAPITEISGGYAVETLGDMLILHQSPSLKGGSDVSLDLGQCSILNDFVLNIASTRAR